MTVTAQEEFFKMSRTSTICVGANTNESIQIVCILVKNGRMELKTVVVFVDILSRYVVHRRSFQQHLCLPLFIIT